MLLLLAPKLPPLFSSRSNFKWKISNQISKQLDVVYRLELKVHFIKSVGKLPEINLQYTSGDTAQI
jgi:hypothetical protein